MRVKLVSNNWSLLLSDWFILGLRYIMHRHPWISAFVGVGSNLAMLVMIMLVSWTRFLTWGVIKLRSKPRKKRLRRTLTMTMWRKFQLRFLSRLHGASFGPSSGSSSLTPSSSSWSSPSASSPSMPTSTRPPTLASCTRSLWSRLRSSSPARRDTKILTHRKPLLWTPMLLSSHGMIFCEVICRQDHFRHPVDCDYVYH